MLFQSLGKLPIISVRTRDSKNIKELQNALADLTYYISKDNLFLQGLIIEINLLER